MPKRFSPLPGRTAIVFFRIDRRELHGCALPSRVTGVLLKACQDECDYLGKRAATTGRVVSGEKTQA